MNGLAKSVILLGGLLVLAGLGMLLAVRWNWHLPLGRLPGDLSWRGKGWSVSFPLATCLLVSVVLSALLWVANHLRR